MQKKIILSSLWNSYFFSWILFSLLFTSCVNTKKSTYFYGSTDGTIASNEPIPQSLIQNNDILSILVSSASSDASSMFNPQLAGNNNQSLSTDQSSNTGYLVSTEGYIQFPILGNIKAAGLTKTNLEESITKILLQKGLLIDPVVSIRFLNFRVTVLGEVNKPSVVTMPNEKLSLLEALGLAGDITIFGNRQNVMVIREENQQKILKRLDLNSTEIFTSPYYYLRSNDIVYVEPNKAKVASTSRSSQWLPILLSGLSFAAIVADRIIK
ncbi:MAG: polysaccharide biosynthesis/export family protein [Chitinophagaceae bacterium]